MENKKMTKGIILSGITNSGKTTTIDYFLRNHISLDSDYKLLYPESIPNDKTPPIAIFEYIPQKKIIVIMRNGDTGTMIQSYYKACFDQGYNNIDIIIGCSRTSGETVTIHQNNCNEIFWLGKQRSSFDKDSIEVKVKHICEATAILIKELLSRII